jgi:hypothetical protein
MFDSILFKIMYGKQHFKKERIVNQWIPRIAWGLGFPHPLITLSSFVIFVFSFYFENSCSLLSYGV